MQKVFSLSRPIGENVRVNPQDVKRAKLALKKLDLYEDEDRDVSGIATSELIDAIRGFQQANELKSDGLMQPGGPTERLLNTALWESQNNETDARPLFDLSAPVGENSPNNPEDVAAVKEALSLAGYSQDEDAAPGKADSEFFGNIRLFKRDFNLSGGNKIGMDDRSNAVLARLSRPNLPDRKLLRTPTRKAGTNRSSRRQIAQTGGRGSTQRSAAKSRQALPQAKRIAERKNEILKNIPSVFDIKRNPNATPNRPRFEIRAFSEVKELDPLIVAAAKKHGVDADLVRAVVYLETAGGWYDGIFVPFDANSTIRPMNIHAEEWKGLGYSREELKDPRKNIDAGVRILKAIRDRIQNPTIEKIGSVYNYLGATVVNDYGKSIAKFYREKPWLK